MRDRDPKYGMQERRIVKINRSAYFLRSFGKHFLQGPPQGGGTALFSLLSFCVDALNVIGEQIDKILVADRLIKIGVEANAESGRINTEGDDFSYP